MARTAERANGITALIEELPVSVELMEQEISQGRFQRAMAIMSAFAAVVSGFEAYIQHTRGAFAHWLMWTPVWLTPPMTVAGLAAVFSERVARLVLPVISAVTLLDGVIGFIFHVRGVQRMPGGFKLGQYNIVIGPPIFAPMLMCTVGILGGLASMLRRELPLRAISAATPRPSSVLPSNPLARYRFEIGHGQFQRGLALTSALFAVLAGGEAYFEHLRGSFNQRLMWTPVWVTPPMVAAGVGAMKSERIARVVLPFVSIVTFFDGVLGFLLHLRGIKRMPGGLNSLHFSITLGPPLFAPLLFCSVGILGLIASILRREE